jgi:hypothetical protein
LSIKNVAPAILVIVETFIPPGKRIPSSGILNAKTSPVGQSP